MSTTAKGQQGLLAKGHEPRVCVPSCSAGGPGWLPLSGLAVSVEFSIFLSAHSEIRAQEESGVGDLEG